MDLPPHPVYKHATTIPLYTFGSRATFGDLFRHYRHRCLGFKVDFPYDIAEDPRPSHKKLNGDYESTDTYDVTPARRRHLARLVGTHIQVTRNKALIRPAIAELCQLARDTPMPPDVIYQVNVGRLKEAVPPYRGEVRQTTAFQGEVFKILNTSIEERAECFPELELIGPHTWCQVDNPSNLKISGLAFGEEADEEQDGEVQLFADVKTQIVAQSSPPRSKSLMEELLDLADRISRRSKKDIDSSPEKLDKFIRQALDIVTTRHPLLYLFSSYNCMIPIMFRPPTVDSPYTTMEVGDEYLRYPTGEIYQPDGTFSHDLGTVSITTALLAMTFHRVNSPPWDWESTYSWPTSNQIQAWPKNACGSLPLDDEFGDPDPKPRRSPRDRKTGKCPSPASAKSVGKKASSTKVLSSRSRAVTRGPQALGELQQNAQLRLTTFFPYATSTHFAFSDLSLHNNASFNAITQPNHPELGRGPRLLSASDLDSKGPGQLGIRANFGTAPSLTFGEQIGQGHLGVVFAGKFCVNEGKYIEVAIKLVIPKSFYSKKDGPLPVDGDGNPKLSSEDAEAAIRHEGRVYEIAKSLQGKVIPRCFGLWHGYIFDLDGVLDKEIDVFILVTELLADDTTHHENIIHAYNRLHDAGILHGDVEPRHWKNGLIIDLERAVLKPKPKAPRQRRKLTVYEDPYRAAPEFPITVRRWTELAKEELELVQSLVHGDSDAQHW